MLTASAISKHFGGVAALTGVSLDVLDGRVVGLVGPNGSGKTTLLNILTGYLRADAGRVAIDHKDVTGWKVHRLVASGVGRTYQTPKLFKSLTVRQNVEAALEYSRRQPSVLHGLVADLGRSAGDRAERADVLLEEVGLASSATRFAGELNLGQARLLEVARALALASSLLMLDEPAAGLSDEESAAVGTLLRQLVKQRLQLGVLIIEHNVEFVRRYCDYVYVLNNGQLLKEGKPDEVVSDRAVIEAYIGVDD